MRSRLLENGSVKTDLCKDNRGDGDLQSRWPASSDVSRLAYCCCIAVIACGITFHMARASSRLTSVHVNTSQNNSGCEVLQRVHRSAARSHMLKMRMCVHKQRKNMEHSTAMSLMLCVWSNVLTTLLVITAQHAICQLSVQLCAHHTVCP